MKNEDLLKIVRILFAVPWLIFGLQHFMYADFVATLVPAFMPFKLFFAYLTGAAMIAAGIGLIVNKASSIAAMLLGLMLTSFILLIHIPALVSKPLTFAALTRPLQDIALVCASFLLANALSSNNKAANFGWLFKASRYLFALMLIGFGVQQFLNPDFLTAKIPSFMPLRIFWVYLTGSAMILTSLSVIFNIKAQLAAVSLGVFMLSINLLNHLYLLANDFHNPLLWTAAMLDLAVTSGVFILALHIHSFNNFALKTEARA